MSGTRASAVQARSPVTPFVGLTNHPGRNPEPSANLDHSMLSRLQQLSIDWVDADSLRGNTLLQYRGPPSVHSARYGLHVLPELLPLRRLENAVDLECDRGEQSVLECAVGGILRRHDRTEDIDAIPDGRETDSAIQRERRMCSMFVRSISTGTLLWRVEVLQPTVVITLQVDPRWKQEVQRSSLPAARRISAYAFPKATSMRPWLARTGRPSCRHWGCCEQHRRAGTTEHRLCSRPLSARTLQAAGRRQK